MTDKSTVRALAQFFDDIRLESTGKLILIGQYFTDLVLAPGVLPTDRLAILITVRWPKDFVPNSFAIRIEVTGQAPIVQEMPPPPPMAQTDAAPSPFAGVTAQTVIHCRFIPLRVGDCIDVWVQVDGENIPAGRLSVTGVPPAAMVMKPTQMVNPTEAQ